MTRTASKPRQVPALACAVLLSCATGAWAQEVSVATLQNVPADMIEPAPAKCSEKMPKSTAGPVEP